MNSGRDLPKEGFPHSDIRGSTIARISPRLFAACHVLHRLLAPRHPPNALITLQIAHHRPHAGPNRAPQGSTPHATSSEAARAYAQSHSTYAYQPISIFTCQRSPATTQSPAARAVLRRFWKRSLVESLVSG